MATKVVAVVVVKVELGKVGEGWGAINLIIFDFCSK